MNNNVIIVVAAIVFGGGLWWYLNSSDEEWTTSDQTGCVQNCMEVVRSDSNWEAFCGKKLVTEYCQCYCDEVGKMNPNLYVEETDEEAEAAVLKCIDTGLIDCLEREGLLY